jgi:hypothetical protein
MTQRALFFACFCWLAVSTAFNIYTDIENYIEHGSFSYLFTPIIRLIGNGAVAFLLLVLGENKQQKKDDAANNTRRIEDCSRCWVDSHRVEALRSFSADSTPADREEQNE